MALGAAVLLNQAGEGTFRRWHRVNQILIALLVVGALVAPMWISYTAVYGDANVTITALDGHGKVIDTPTPYILANNNNNVYTVPGPARTVTVEGRGALVATLLARPK